MKALLQFTERFGSMLSRALLTVLYFAVLGPFAVLYRLVCDPLHLRRRPRGRRAAQGGAGVPARDRQAGRSRLHRGGRPL